jgi:hypothetical protein
MGTRANDEGTDLDPGILGTIAHGPTKFDLSRSLPHFANKALKHGSLSHPNGSDDGDKLTPWYFQVNVENFENICIIHRGFWRSFGAFAFALLHAHLATFALLFRILGSRRRAIPSEVGAIGPDGHIHLVIYDKRPVERFRFENFVQPVTCRGCISNTAQGQS